MEFRVVAKIFAPPHRSSLSSGSHAANQWRAERHQTS
jgi:hypothetical protein